MITKKAKSMFIVLLLSLLFTSCARPTVQPATIPTVTDIAFPLGQIPVQTSEAATSLLKPGSKIGQMSLQISRTSIPSWSDYCMIAFSDSPGGDTIDCRMPLLPEFEIGVPWSAASQELLDANWQNLAWELFVDGRPVDLDAFGTTDFDSQTEDGAPIRSRRWNLKLVNPTAGDHEVRYLLHINQEIDNGLAVEKPRTLELVVNLTLGEPADSSAGIPPSYEPSWWHRTVFYEIFVRSFAESTSGPLADDGIGDLQGLIEKLDYLNDGDPATNDDLGVMGIWLMPIMSSPSYHGYDVTDYFMVNPEYGTNDDFTRLLEEAHKRGMRVIIDLVINHTSVEHPWFIEARDQPQSPRRDWYIWSDVKPDYLGPWGEEVWHWSPSGYYYGIFWSGMPDLNLKNPQVTSEVEEIARYWLEEVGVDGFRLDAARHLIEQGRLQVDTGDTHAWWQQFRTVYKSANPEAMAVGEIWSSGADVVRYVQADELDLAFDFDLADAILSGAYARSASTIQSALKQSYNLYGGGLSATFLTNHDMNRVMSQLEHNVGKAKLAAAVLLTAPGVPFVYYGEEIGMTGQKPDELIRTPMQWTGQMNAGFTASVPWEPVNFDYQVKNVADQRSDPASLLNFYRELIHLRNDHPALQTGGYSPVDSQSNHILAYLRNNQDDLDLVVINLSEQPVSEYALTLANGALSGRYQASLLYGTDAKLPDLESSAGGGFDAYQPRPEIPGEGILIIHLDSIR